MSDEPRKDQEDEVEAHRNRAVSDEPAAEGEVEGDDEVEAHRKHPRTRA